MRGESIAGIAVTGGTCIWVSPRGLTNQVIVSTRGGGGPRCGWRGARIQNLRVWGCPQKRIRNFHGARGCLIGGLPCRGARSHDRTMQYVWNVVVVFFSYTLAGRGLPLDCTTFQIPHFFLPLFPRLHSLLAVILREAASQSHPRGRDPQVST